MDDAFLGIFWAAHHVGEGGRRNLLHGPRVCGIHEGRLLYVGGLVLLWKSSQPPVTYYGVLGDAPLQLERARSVKYDNKLLETAALGMGNAHTQSHRWHIATAEGHATHEKLFQSFLPFPRLSLASCS